MIVVHKLLIRVDHVVRRILNDGRRIGRLMEGLPVECGRRWLFGADRSRFIFFPAEDAGYRGLFFLVRYIDGGESGGHHRAVGGVQAGRCGLDLHRLNGLVGHGLVEQLSRFSSWRCERRSKPFLFKMRVAYACYVRFSASGFFMLLDFKNRTATRLMLEISKMIASGKLPRMQVRVKGPAQGVERVFNSPLSWKEMRALKTREDLN